MLFAIVNVDTNGLVWITEEPDQLLGAPLISVPLNRDDWPDPMLEQWVPHLRAFAPVPRRDITHLAFLSRFTAEEFGAVAAARAANTTIEFEWQKFFVSDGINLDDPRTAAGVGALEQLGLIGAGRTAEILG